MGCAGSRDPGLPDRIHALLNNMDGSDEVLWELYKGKRMEQYTQRIASLESSDASLVVRLYGDGRSIDQHGFRTYVRDLELTDAELKHLLTRLTDVRERKR